VKLSYGESRAFANFNGFILRDASLRDAPQDEDSDLMVRSASRRQVYVACVNLATMRVSNHETTGEALMIRANRKTLYGLAG
jgi:hypothetical protein